MPQSLPCHPLPILPRPSLKPPLRSSCPMYYIAEKGMGGFDVGVSFDVGGRKRAEFLAESRAQRYRPRGRQRGGDSGRGLGGACQGASSTQPHALSPSSSWDTQQHPPLLVPSQPASGPILLVRAGKGRAITLCLGWSRQLMILHLI